MADDQALRLPFHLAGRGHHFHGGRLFADAGGILFNLHVLHVERARARDRVGATQAIDGVGGRHGRWVAATRDSWIAVVGGRGPVHDLLSTLSPDPPRSARDLRHDPQPADRAELATDR